MELTVKERTILGKKTRSLRREGLIPAELYGHGVENRHLAVAKKEFEKLHKAAGASLITLVTEGKERIPAMIAEVTQDPLQGIYLSIDLHAVRMDEKMHAKVPLVYVGEAPAVKNGCVLIKVMHELEIEALPHNVPHEITVNIGTLEAPENVIKVNDLGLPTEVKARIPEDTVIATVAEKRAEEEVPQPVPEAATEPAPEAAAGEEKGGQ